MHCEYICSGTGIPHSRQRHNVSPGKVGDMKYHMFERLHD